MISMNIMLQDKAMLLLDEDYFNKHRIGNMPFDVYLGLQAGMEAAKQIRIIIGTYFVPALIISDSIHNSEQVTIHLTDHDYKTIKEYKSLVGTHHTEAQIVSSLVASSVLMESSVVD